MKKSEVRKDLVRLVISVGWVCAPVFRKPAPLKWAGNLLVSKSIAAIKTVSWATICRNRKFHNGLVIASVN